MEKKSICWAELNKFVRGAMPDCDLSTLYVTTKVVYECCGFGKVVGVKVNGTRYDGTEVVVHYVIKMPCASKHFLHIYAKKEQRLLWIETFAYLMLLPIFRKFQPTFEPFEAYPEAMGYSCPYHESGTKELFIVENMIHKDYVLKDCKEPLDFNHLEVVLKTYAEFHAISLAMKQQYPLQFARLSNIEHLEFTFIDREHWKRLKRLMKTRMLNLFDGGQYPHHRQLVKILSRKLLDLVNSTVKIDNDYNDNFPVFCHGNGSLHNILFKYGDKTKPNVPTKVCLIDFQMLRYGSPIFDLSYFIFTATDKATRDEHYDQLIDIYYREVCMRLEQMGSPPAVVFPYDKFQLRLKRFSVLGYFMAQMALYTMLRAPSIKVTDQMTEAEIKESMERNIVESEALYDERIKGMLIDFVEKGYFDFLDEEYPDMEFDESTTDSTDDNMVDEEDL